MSKDIRNNKAARNAQPPSSHDDGGESVYGNSKVTAANDVAKTKTERLNPIGSGILEDQPREHGNQYPGRPYPPTQAVTTCVPKEGVGKKSAETETDSNRHELNSHVEKAGY